MDEPVDRQRAANGSGKPDMTTSSAARALQISVATVKRWAEVGLLPSHRTPGGHRRFWKEDVDRLRIRLASDSGSLGRWVEKLLHDPDRAVSAALHLEREHLGSWSRVADSLGPVIRQIGHEWEAGTLCVLDEHVASTRLSRALSRCCEQFEARPSAPRALLATPEGEEHTLGLSLVELCMRERGWRAIWAGRATPGSELVSAAARGLIDAIALSASVASAPGSLAREIALLAPVCRARGIRLIVGGNGPWPERLEYGDVERTFAGLERWMSAVEGSSREVGAPRRELNGGRPRGASPSGPSRGAPWPRSRRSGRSPD